MSYQWSHNIRMSSSDGILLAAVRTGLLLLFTKKKEKKKDVENKNLNFYSI